MLLFLMVVKLPAIAQCVATITGDNCAGSVITAHLTTGDAREVLWVRNGIASMIRTNYSSTGNTVTTGLDVPSGVAFDKEGNMYVAEYRNNSIVKFSKGSDVGFVVAGGHGKGAALDQFNGPEDVQVDSAGNIYVADVYNYRIMKWVPGSDEGQVIAGGNGPGSALNQFNWPNSISLDSAGNIYVADVYNDRIIKWNQGALSGIVVAGGNGFGHSANQLYHPLGVFVDSRGNIYISDYLNYRIQRWAPGASRGVTVAGGNGNGEGPDKIIPGELIVDKNDNIFVIDSYSQGVKKWQPGKKFSYTVAGGYGLGHTPYHIYFPRGLSLDTKGNLYVVQGGDGEPGHGCIMRYTRTTHADSDYFTANNAAKYKAFVFDGSGCLAKTNVINVITIPARPSPITGLLSVLPQQSNVSYSVQRDTNNTYLWTFPSDVEIITGQGTSVITVNWGNTSGEIQVNAVNNCGSSDTRYGYVTVSGNYITGVKTAITSDMNQGKLLSVYPNPAKDKVMVSLEAFSDEKLTVSINDLAGKLLRKQFFTAVKGRNSTQLDISGFSPGIYTLTIYGKRSGLLTTKILKQ